MLTNPWRTAEGRSLPAEIVVCSTLIFFWFTGLSSSESISNSWRSSTFASLSTSQYICSGNALASMPIALEPTCSITIWSSVENPTDLFWLNSISESSSPHFGLISTGSPSCAVTGSGTAAGSSSSASASPSLPSSSSSAGFALGSKSRE